MTREAVRSGFVEFVDDVIAIAYEEFDVVGALREGTTGSGSQVVSKLVKQSELLDREVVRPELREYRDALLDQFEYLLEFADGDEPFEAFAEDIIAADLYRESRQSASGSSGNRRFP